jgi:hypothetical protein
MRRPRRSELVLLPRSAAAQAVTPAASSCGRLIAFDLRPHPIAPTDDPAGQVLCLDHEGTGRPDDHVVCVTAPSERQIVNDDVVMAKQCERVAHDVFS